MCAVDRETPPAPVLDEETAIAAFRMFVRQSGISGVTFGNSSLVVGAGDVSGWAFFLFSQAASQLPRDGSVTTPCGIPVRVQIDNLGDKSIARLFQCAAPVEDIAGQTTFF